MFGKACRMSLLELLSTSGERFPVTTTKRGFRGSCWKITFIQMQRKWLTPFIREINLQYVLLTTYCNLTGLEWSTPLERATVVSSERLSLWQRWVYTAKLLGFAGCGGCLDVSLWLFRTKGLGLVICKGFSSSLLFFPNTRARNVWWFFTCLPK